LNRDGRGRRKICIDHFDGDHRSRGKERTRQQRPTVEGKTETSLRGFGKGKSARGMQNGEVCHEEGVVGQTGYISSLYISIPSSPHLPKTQNKNTSELTATELYCMLFPTHTWLHALCELGMPGDPVLILTPKPAAFSCMWSDCDDWVQHFTILQSRFCINTPLKTCERTSCLFGNKQQSWAIVGE
jgi:hypothetical protein